MYAKFKSATEIELAPHVCVRANTSVIGYNLDSNGAMLRADGYLPVVASNQPGPYYDRKYVLQENVIYEAWSPKDIDAVRSIRVAELNQKASATVAPFMSTFSAAEVMTWDRQDDGAEDLTTNPESTSSGAVLVRAIAQVSGTSLPETISDIRAATKDPNSAAGYIVGTQKRIHRQLVAAKTMEELLSISTNIELPV